jgi:hypothetical protein
MISSALRPRKKIHWISRQKEIVSTTVILERVAEIHFNLLLK